MATNNPQSIFDILNPQRISLPRLFNQLDHSFRYLSQTIYGSLSGAKASTKPFIIGILPPEIQVNFVPVEKRQTKVSSISVDVKQTRSGGNARPGIPASNKSLGKIPRVTTKFTANQLAKSINQGLIRRGQSKERAAQLTPIMVGHVSAELRREKSTFVTNNYNIGNVHASKAGKFKDPSKGTGESNAEIPTPSGGTYVYGVDNQISKDGTKTPYPVYFQAAGDLDSGVDKWMTTTTQNWPGVLDANTPEEYVNVLVQEKDKKYFTDPDVNGYINRVTAGSKLVSQDYLAQGNSEFAGKDDNDRPVTASSEANIMSSGNITAADSDDKIGAFYGRNLTRANLDRTVASEKLTTDLQQQIDAIREIPPLLLLINPSEFGRSYQQTVDKIKTRRKHQIHMWLEKPLSLSSRGVSAAQYAFNASGSGGLTGALRIHSLSYKNLMSLVAIYRNNGHIYASGQGGNTDNLGVRLLATSIFIYYDNHFYIGSFDEFSVTDDANKPHNMAYSFKFQVRYDFDSNLSADKVSTGV